MAEYIDRDAAIAACFDGFADCRDDCAANIRSIPTADVVEVVRGTWEIDDEGYVRCGVCHCKDPLYNIELVELTDFCPNCGADMRPRPKEETC